MDALSQTPGVDHYVVRVSEEKAKNLTEFSLGEYRTVACASGIPVCGHFPFKDTTVGTCPVWCGTGVSTYTFMFIHSQMYSNCHNVTDQNETIDTLF